MKHELKIHMTHYKRVLAGTKTFEIRDNDRSFQKGDEVILRAFDPSDGRYFQTIDGLGKEPANNLHFRIGDVYPIDDKRVAFSLLPLEAKQ